jgi:hypothetical protein
MPQHDFQLTDEEWKRKIEQQVLQNHADIQRLQRRISPRQNAHIGLQPHAANAFQTTTTTAP